MDPITARIHQAIAHLTNKTSVGPTDVSTFLGLPNSQTAKNWETRGPSEGGLVAAAERGISVLWLKRGEGPMLTNQAPDEPPSGAARVASYPIESSFSLTDSQDEFVVVTRVDVKFSNGHGQILYSEEERPPLMFRADFLQKMGIPKGKAFVALAEGVSNEPKIYDGAVVLINAADKRLNGEFFAFRVDGELLIKRLDALDGIGVIATAENSNFKPKTKVYNDAEDFEVIGKVVWTGTVL